MLPSLLTRDIEYGLRQYLLTAYEPSDGFFRGVMQRFLDRDGSWMKGPYVQVGLPFRLGEKQRDFFPEFKTEFPGYTHQEAAWERLKNVGSAANTLVATGTGSGKTECFLYPLLQHCAREAAAGHKGVKALIIYPMNALATDQARRIASTIHAEPAFKHLRAALYVGGVTHGNPGGGVMTPTEVITDRGAMRENPPDILLTNYKMLDYLLIRPRDRQLWAQNETDTLRYIVVDELHTFDGAQGTDLALLLRRLKARLKTDSEAIAHIGTSATLGGSGDTARLRDYASKVFGSEFPPDCVIKEDRLDKAEFLGGSDAEFLMAALPDVERLLDAGQYAGPEAAVAGWFPLFFPGEDEPGDVSDPAWRQALGSLLKRHLLFWSLLDALQPGVQPIEALEAALIERVPASAMPHVRSILDAMLVLIAWARSAENSSLPFVTLRVQAWLRELRRLVAPLAVSGSEAVLRSATELSALQEEDNIYLPLIQCSECHATAWLSRAPGHSQNQLASGLEEIYNSWFRKSADTVRLYPHLKQSQARIEGIDQFACVRCGFLSLRPEPCNECGGERLVPVFRTTGKITVVRGDKSAIYHEPKCAACGADALLLIGSRSTTLGAQLVEQTWSSRFNDDARMIAFSDSVQDAAHRAGFISARTYSHIARKAIARCADYLVNGAEPWSSFRRQIPILWKQPGSPLATDHAAFVSTFIAPDMAWQRQWDDLYTKGIGLPANTGLIDLVEKRLAWQAFSELTYMGNRGRSLDRIGLATLWPAHLALESAARRSRDVLRQEFGADATEQEVYQWLAGIVVRMRRQGGILEPTLRDYVVEPNLYVLRNHGGRERWMPRLGPSTPHPVFLSLSGQRYTEQLTGDKSWYTRWLRATIGINVLLPQDHLQLHREAAFAPLQAEKVVTMLTGRNYETAALNPDALYIYLEPCSLQTDVGARALTVPPDIAERLQGMPCLDAMNDRYAHIGACPKGPLARIRAGEIRRVIAAEHTGLLERDEREQIENRFKAKKPEPWYENLLSATPTLEMGVDIGDLSSVMLCSVPPTVASYLQRIGRAGRRDGNAHTSTLADGASPHDLYFYEEPAEMISGDVTPPGAFLKAPEVLRRQLCAFCMDDWVGSYPGDDPYPEKTQAALDAIDKADMARFPYSFIEHVKQNGPRLLDGFFTLLGEDADEAMRERLTVFIDGSDTTNSLKVCLMAPLMDLTKERKTYAAKVKDLRVRLKPLKSRPPDEATKAEIEELTREEVKFQSLAAEINGRDLLNTLTDAGIIPNYAFPEAGITLKSVLWRKPAPEEGIAKKTVSVTHKFERPAASALSEFAPENIFYASHRRVEIDQVNMDRADLEFWRLCPTCDHMQNLEINPVSEPVCPRCQDQMWNDVGQKRQLLRFRQAVANTHDRTARIDDSVEEREPRFHLRQMLVDFTASDVEEAWALKSAELPFGFEFIRSASFRDVNFGELGSGDKFKVADLDACRPGFKLCKLCGKVQKDPKPSKREEEEKEPEQTHAFDCIGRSKNAPENIIDCLYLYREFHSEALRILVPFTRVGMDVSVVQSFSAAVQLGLKERYGGQVSHLRVLVQEVPEPESGYKRQYLLLYDSVPGGTGYLHQLLAQDADTLKEVFRLALGKLKACRCQSDPDKDGCYNCVYQYRLGRIMSSVSRRKAIDLLEELIENLHLLERTDSISGISLNSALESVLERRFIESIRRMSKVGGLPAIQLVQEVINGRTGYQMQIGDRQYLIELQIDLDASVGVKRASRPDFLIRPRKGSCRKPIAVFCDGWTYHRDIVRDDAAKRTAILNSGKYHVWSVVMEDVELAVEKKAESDLGHPFKEPQRVHNTGFVQPSGFRAAGSSAFASNAVAELLFWLNRDSNDTDSWIAAAWDASVNWLLRLVPGDRAAYENIERRNTEVRESLPIWLADKPEGSFEAGLGGGRLFDICGVWLSRQHAAVDRTVAAPIVLLYDDVTNAEEKKRHLEWRWWLWAANWMQAIPGMSMTTRAGIDGGDYGGLNPAPTADEAPETDSASTDAAIWEEIRTNAAASMAVGLSRLEAARVAPPDEVGYSLTNEIDDELSMAELVWLERKIAVLLGEYVADRPIWESSGWTVIEAVDNWPARLQEIL